MKGRSRNYIIMALLGLSVLGFGGLAAAANSAGHALRLTADVTLPPGDMSRGADNFYVSDKLNGKTVTFSNIYDMKVAGNLFVPKTLKAVRQSVVDEIDEFRSIVEADDFKAAFPVIGETRLKTLPKGFPKDFPYPDYIRPKDYSVCHAVDDDFFRGPDWLERTARVFQLMKPYNDFINYTIDECGEE